jgi:hypothetical protein
MGEDFISICTFSGVIDPLNPPVKLALYPWYKNPLKDKPEQCIVSTKFERL